MSVNLIGAISSINCFLPLIRNGELKKIIYITSPTGDAEFTRKCGVTVTIGYTATKAAMNLVMSKYAAELKGEGIKTLALSPGWVDTDGSTQFPAHLSIDDSVNANHKPHAMYSSGYGPDARGLRNGATDVSEGEPGSH